MLDKKEIIDKLLENLVEQAKYYLSKFDSFYPFGAIVLLDGTITPTSISDGDEFPDKIDLLNKLECALRNEIKKNNHQAIAICVDVLTIPPYQTEKTDAIEIRIDTINFGNINYYLPYRKSEYGNYNYYEIFSNIGSLELWSKNENIKLFSLFLSRSCSSLISVMISEK